MEEKLLQEKELAEMLRNLEKLNGHITITPAVGDVFITVSMKDFVVFGDAYPNYYHNPMICTIWALREFFTSSVVVEALAKLKAA